MSKSVNMTTDKTSVCSKLQPKANYSKINDDEEIILKQIWTYLLHIWGMEVDGTVAFSDRRLTAYNSNNSLKTSTSKEKKSSWFGFGSSSSNAVTTKDKDPEDKLEKGNIKYTKGTIYPSFEGMDREGTERIFWNMLRADPPDSLIWRFARARKFNSSKATKMIFHTIKFYQKHNIEELINKGELEIFKNNEKGVMLNFNLQKAVIVGRDLKNRPFILVRPKFHHSSDQSENDIEKFALIIIEIARLYMKTGFASIIFDLTDFSLSNMDYSPVKFLITCFEAHYPESLGCLLIHKAPWLFSPIWNIVKNWLDPVVASKIVFTKNINELTKFISKEQVPKYLGGENDFDLDNYIAPDGSKDEALKDTNAKEALLKMRDELILRYKEVTVQWIETDDSQKSKDLWDKRIALGQEITNNYRELDKHIRSRSYYDISASLEL